MVESIQYSGSDGDGGKPGTLAYNEGGIPGQQSWMETRKNIVGGTLTNIDGQKPGQYFCKELLLTLLVDWNVYILFGS